MAVHHLGGRLEPLRRHLVWTTPGRLAGRDVRRV